jgi:DNA-binding LacI/PurR family transcriptional regulator
MATIKDVAAMAGVSASTVSYAINGTRPISAEKKKLIMDVMRRLHYRPHIIARSLASKRTHIIAILFSHGDHGIGLSELDFIMGASKCTIRHGYHLVIWTLQTNKEEELQQLICQELVDGIILMDVHTGDRRVAILKKQGIPVILLGRDSDVPSESFIDVDFFTTMMQCISYLKTLGHQHLFFINQSEKSLVSGYGPVVRSHEAFEYFCKNFDIDGKEIFCGSDPVQVCAETEQLLTANPDTTAFIVMNERALPGLIRGIEKKQFSIPGDISIVSIVSSARSSSFVLPPVTAFEIDIPRVMDLTVTQLIAKLEGRYAELSLRLIPCILRERQSTGPCRD